MRDAVMLEEQFDSLLALLQANPLLATVIGVALLALFCSKPKETFKLAGFCLFIAVVFYFITLFAETLGSGTEQKDRMIHKSREELGR